MWYILEVCRFTVKYVLTKRYIFVNIPLTPFWLILVFIQTLNLSQMSNAIATKKREELNELLERFSMGGVTLPQLFSEIQQILEGYDPTQISSTFTIIWAVQSFTIVYHDGTVTRISWTNKIETLEKTA